MHPDFEHTGGQQLAADVLFIFVPVVVTNRLTEKYQPSGKFNVPMEWLHSRHRALSKQGRRAWI